MTTQEIQSNGHRAQATTQEAPIYSIDEAMEETSRALHAVQAAGGDTRKLSPAHREGVLTGLCRALRLNPLTSPIIYLVLNGKEVLYVTRQATDQIAARLKLNRRTVSGPDVRDFGGTKMIFCQVEVTAPDGRSEMATATLPPGDLVNALMKAETKAKRRATLSIAGLGLLCEDELETIPGARAPGAGTSDLPAESATVNALDAFRETLALTGDLAGFACAYHDHSEALGGTAAKDVNDAIVKHAAKCGYHLNADEAHALCGRTLDEHLASAFDELSSVPRAEDDTDGDGVIASVVRVIRKHTTRPKATKVRIYNVAVKVALALKVENVKARLDAALNPQPPTDGPGGGQRTLTTQAPPDAHGSAAPVAASAAPLASANDGPRRVYDDEHRRPTPHKPEPWQLDDAAMRAHIAGKGSRTEIERAAACHGEHQGPAFLTLLAHQLVAVDRAYQRRTTGIDASMGLIAAQGIVERSAVDGTRSRAAKAAELAQRLAA